MMTNNYSKLTKNMCNFNFIQIGGSKKKEKKNIKYNIEYNIEYNEQYLLELLKNKDWEKIVGLYSNPRDIKINGNNLLHLACSRGEINAINYYLLKYPELFYVANDDGNTCAHLLTKYGYYDILKKLLPKFPEAITFINKDGDSLLELTIKEPQIMGWIIALLNPEYFKEMDASKISSLKSMIELIKLNNGKDIYYQLINKLISKGFKLNQPSPYMPLSIASKLDKPHIVETLLKAGADPNIKDTDELTPLIEAVSNKSYKSVIKLLENGSNINYAGPEGDHLPINIALQNKDSKMVNILLNSKYSKNKIDYNFKNRNLDLPIHTALMNNLESSFLTPTNLTRFIYKSNLYEANIKNITPIDLLNEYSKKENINYLEKVIEKKKIKLTSSSKKIKLPILEQKNFGLFNSDILHNAIYTIMILRKYKNLGIPVMKDKTINDKDFKEFYSMMNYKSREGKLIVDIINIYYDNFAFLLPHLILWKSGDLNYFNDNLKVSVNKLLKNKKIDFIMIKLSLIPNSSSTHANILIYDKNNNVLERFEPYGPNEMLEEDKLNKFIEKLGKVLFNSKLKFIFPKLFLQDAKFQIVSSDSDPDNKKTGDPLGYCLAWCFWYLELRLNNPKIKSKELVNNAFTTMIKEKDPESNQVLDYIRNYSQSLDKLKNKFLHECKIPEKEFYSNTYNDNILEIILEKINNFDI